MPNSHPEVVALTAPHRTRVVAAAIYLLGCIPTVIVIAAIGGVAWYGHTHEWKLPKFSELTGEVPEPKDWCDAHSVPESICIACQPDLCPLPKSLGSCQPHGLAECVLCNPTQAQVPATLASVSVQAQHAAEMLAHPARSRNNPECPSGATRRIQLTSDEDRKKAGIEFDTVTTGSVVEGITAAGELTYDQARVAHLAARQPGVVWKVYKRLGQRVAPGEVLAIIEAAEVGKAKAEILQAFGTLQLKRRALAILSEANVAAQARVREAEAAVTEAELRLAGALQSMANLGLPFNELTATLTLDQLKSKLQLHGIPPAIAATIDPQTASANLMPMIASTGGLVVSRDVVAGEVVDPTKVLFELVDTSNLWLTLDIKGEDATQATLGRSIRFTPDHATPGSKPVDAVISWRASAVDPRTRTLKVRADVPNAAGELLANTYGTGFVLLREAKDIPVVPQSAVHSDGCCQVVFVRDRAYSAGSGYKIVHVRRVRTGGTLTRASSKGDTEMVEVVGLLPGEVIVTEGGGALLGEVLKGDLGDGCCGNHKKD